MCYRVFIPCRILGGLCAISLLWTPAVFVFIQDEELHVRAFDGEANVTLPCDYSVTRSFGKAKIMWSLGDRRGPVLSMKTSSGNIIPSHDYAGRASIVQGSRLLLKNLSLSDTGVYVCTVRIPEDTPTSASSSVHLDIVRELKHVDVEAKDPSSFLVRWRVPPKHALPFTVNRYRVHYQRGDTVIQVKTIMNETQREVVISDLEADTMYAVHIVGYDDVLSNIIQSRNIFVKTKRKDAIRGSDLHLEWAVPATTFGEIYSYRIAFRLGQTNYLEKEVYDTECDVPLKKFETASAYEVQVTAKNSVDYGENISISLQLLGTDAAGRTLIVTDRFHDDDTFSGSCATRSISLTYVMLTVVVTIPEFPD